MKDIIGNFKFLTIETDNQVALTHGLMSDFDLETLEKIKFKDDYIDNLKTTIENACFSRIAELKPAIHQETINRIRGIHIMCVNLERIADFCVNITRQTRYLSDISFLARYDYPTMFQTIREAMAGITQVFDTNDLTGALRICKSEFVLDALWEKTFKLLLEDLKKGGHVTDLITTIFIFRYLERIGDSLLNIGEALIFVIMGDRIKIRQFEALEKTLSQSGFKGTLSDIDFNSIWGSRSGCRISKVSRKMPSGFKAQGIFKEGKREKIRREHDNILRWESVFPGLAPRVFGYNELADTASMLVEFLAGCTLDQVILAESPELVENVLFIVEQTVREVWEKTLQYTPGRCDYFAQLQARLDAVRRVHPDFFRPGFRINTFTVASTDQLIASCRAIEAELTVPLTVLIHGDFNTNNIVYNHEEQRVNYIDLYRSRDGDYIQDASVFLVSNFRTPAFEPELRERLDRANCNFLKFFRSFAAKHGDTTFDIRMALALARSFLTSTRFELQNRFAKDMCDRAHFLMDRIISHKGSDWESFRLPESILSIRQPCSEMR